MKARLPVRPTPYPGEDLYSFAERAALVNGIQPMMLGLSARISVRRSADPTVIAQLGSALGVSQVDARAMTLDVYPRVVVGRAGTNQVRTWRLRGVRWVCPRCTPTSGVYLRDWQLALHPLCVECPSLLRSGDEPDTGLLDAPDHRAVATQRRIADVLAESLDVRRSAYQLRDLYRLVTLTALTADNEWPLLVGWEAEARTHAATQHDWTKEPPVNPADAVVVVLECARAMNERQRRRNLIQEGWERLHGDSELSARWGAGLRRDVLPKRLAEGSSTGVPVWSPDAWHAYRTLVGMLTDLQNSTGLGPEHIPGWDMRPGEVFAPPPSKRARRTDLAVVTHMLLSGPAHNTDTERRSRLALGITGSGWGTRRLALGRGVTPQTSREIATFVRQLIDHGLVDYAERRHHLGNAPDLISRLRKLVKRFGLEAHSNDAIGTWIWAESLNPDRCSRCV